MGKAPGIGLRLLHQEQIRPVLLEELEHSRHPHLQGVHVPGGDSHCARPYATRGHARPILHSVPFLAYLHEPSPDSPEGRPWEPNWRVWRPGAAAVAGLVGAGELHGAVALGARALRRSPSSSARSTPRCPTGAACASGASDAYTSVERHARRRHDPLRGQPHRRGAGREPDRGDRDAAAASRHGPLARAAGGTGGALGGRAREASLPPLRGRPHAPLAPADGREVGRVSPRPALDAGARAGPGS